MIKWRKYIVEKYVQNLELKLLGKPKSYDYEFITDFGFNEEERIYFESLFNLNEFLNSETPLIDLLDKEQLSSYTHIINHSSIKVNVNQQKNNKTLFISVVDYFINQSLGDLSDNYLDFQTQIYSLFINGYEVKSVDVEFLKQFKELSDSRQLQYVLFSSYALKLGTAQLISVMIDHIRLITCLTIIKTGKHIGFYKTIEKQIIDFTQSSSAYQNEIINYITKEDKKNFKHINRKLLELRRNISEVIVDPYLKAILNRLIYNHR